MHQIKSRRRMACDLVAVVCGAVMVVSGCLLYNEFVPKAMEASGYNDISDEFGVDENGNPREGAGGGEAAGAAGSPVSGAADFLRNLAAAALGKDPDDIPFFGGSPAGSSGTASAAGRSPGSSAAGRGYDWDRLLSINPQTVGWIWLPGTHIDYPVVQTGNNDDYLGIDFYGEPSVYGNPFADFRFDFSRYPKAQNLVIYGHSSQYGNMIGFEGLDNYTDYAYFREHPCFYFTTIYEPGPPVEYDVAAVLKEDQLFDYRHPAFSTQEEFTEYYKKIKAASIYDTGVEIGPDDDIVTLSTCVFDMYNGRCAVIGKRVPSRGAGVSASGKGPQG